MDDLESDARLFCYGIGSKLFADVYAAMREELSKRGQDLQAEVLDTLVKWLCDARDETERRLRPLATREASTIRGESIEIDGGEEKSVSG